MSCSSFSRCGSLTLLGPMLLSPILAAGGCVGIADYQAAKREAEELALQLQMEQRRSQELGGKVRQLNEKVRELERTTQRALEEAARREREYREIWDELLSFKIPLEQQRVHTQRSRIREGETKPPSELGGPAGSLLPRPTAPASADGNKQRLRQALQEFQKLLDEN